MLRCDTANNVIKRIPNRHGLALSQQVGGAGSQLCGQERVPPNTAALFESWPTPRVSEEDLRVVSWLRFFYQPAGSEPEEYHKWYYNTKCGIRLPGWGSTPGSPSLTCGITKRSCST